MDIAWWQAVLGIFAMLWIWMILDRWHENRMNRREMLVRRERQAQFDEIRDAASDRAALDQLVRDGANLGIRDDSGETPLHRAYSLNRTEAVRNLRAAGAPEKQKNYEGLLPHEMPSVAQVMELIGTGVTLISRDGQWRNAEEGQRIWSALRKVKGSHYRAALKRVMLKNAISVVPDREARNYAVLVIKVGRPGSEWFLTSLLKPSYDPYYISGMREIATDYLNSGNATLRAEAEDWARLTNHKIVIHPGGGGVTWGSS